MATQSWRHQPPTLLGMGDAPPQRSIEDLGCVPPRTIPTVLVVELSFYCSTVLPLYSLVPTSSVLATCYGKTEGRTPSAASDGPFPSPRQRSVISAIRRSNSALKTSRRRRCDPGRYGSSARSSAQRMNAWLTSPTPTCQRAGLLALNNPSTEFRSHRSRLMPIPAGGTKPPRANSAGTI